MMPGSLYLGHLGPIPLYVHWTAIGLVVISWSWLGLDADPVILVAYVLILMVSIVLHELGHGMAARAIARNEAERTVTITLWGLGGLCMSKGNHQALPRLFVVLAGPAVSLALWLAGVSVLAWYGTGTFDTWTSIVIDRNGMYAASMSIGGLTGLLLFVATSMNFMMFVFNMLPIYPLDGGQTLFNGLKLMRLDYDLCRKATMAISVAFAVAYFLWDLDRSGSPNLLLILVLGWALMNAWSHLRHGA
jgi:Zn-dependent protease